MNLELWKKRYKELGFKNYGELAEKANVSKRSIEDIFRGFTKNPRTDTVEAIERALGINEKSPIMERPLSDLAENFIQKYSDLFSEKSFHAYAELYRYMDERQKIFVIGMIVGYLKENGVNINITF